MLIVPMIFMVGFVVLGIFSAVYAGSSKGTSGAVRGKFEKVTFVGGCFWCMEPPFDKLDGVISTTAGLYGGRGEIKTWDYPEG